MFISKGVSEKISKKTTCSSDTQKKSVSVLREQPQHYLPSLINRNTFKLNEKFDGLTNEVIGKGFESLKKQNLPLLKKVDSKEKKAKRNRNLFSLDEIKRIFPATKLLNNNHLKIRSDLKKKQFKKKSGAELIANNSKLLKRRRLKSINSATSDEEQILSNDDETEISIDSNFLPNIKVKISPSNAEKKKKSVKFNEEISYFYQKSEHDKQLFGLHKLFQEY